MGGKALSKYGVETERKTTPEFLKIAEYFQNKIKKDLGLETHIIEFFRQKETHGDLDVLIKLDRADVNLKKYIEDNIETKAINNNNGVVSFEYDNFQIDFIPTRMSIWEASKTFFDYDPTGNLVGKTAHKFGVKYGFEGLILPIRNFNDRISKNIVISRDMRKIFEFLGYDYDRYLKGFDTKEEIFDWTINSKYFDSEMFKMENLNHIDRKRNKKRATYQEFLKYLETNNITKRFKFGDKAGYRDAIDEFFPEVGLKEELKKLDEEDKKNQIISKKFNGNVIMSRHLSLKGKKLGIAMKNFKDKFKNFNEYVLVTGVDEIMKEFDKFIKLKTN
jgi:hypothetical protein